MLAGFFNYVSTVYLGGIALCLAGKSESDDGIFETDY